MKGIALSLAALCISAVSLNTHAINCDTIPQWDSAAVYTKDMQAQEAQKVYKANWWSQNHNPVNYSGQWQEWTYLGDCDVAVNRPPVAVLSISQASSSGSYPVQYTYTFNGTGSHDPDGDQLTYSWDNGASFSTDATKTIAFGTFYDLCEARYYRMALTVKDAQGEMSTAYQSVKVGDAAPGNPRCGSSSSIGVSSSVAANTPPVARITATAVILVAGQIPLGASGHLSTDADGDTLSYLWNFGDGQSASTMSVTHLYANAGTYTLSLTVSDGKGGSNTTTGQIRVEPAHSSSSISFSSSSRPLDVCLFPPFVAGTSYSQGQLVTNSGSLYRCVVPGWCSSTATWAYEPGEGTYWDHAWTLEKSCSGDSSSSVITQSSSSSSSSSIVSSSASSVSSVNNGLPKHALVGYWHNFNNGSGVIRLADVDNTWDVIVIAFADDVGNGTVAFNLDPVLNKAQFIADVATKRAQGKKVVLSFGGQNGTVTLNNATNVANFVNSTAAIMNEYGFDGIDIDLESGANVSWGAPVIGNMITAVKQLDQQFPNLYLSMAPEHPYVHGGMIAATGIWGAYLPIIDGLRNELDLLHVQLYNNGSLATPYASQPLQAGTVDFMVASVKMLIEGFPVANNTQFAGLRPDQVAIGVPSGSRAAGSGFVTIADLNNAVNCLAKLVGCGAIRPNQAYPDFRGVMTWSINWDVADGRPFSIPVNANLDALP
jgi:chitinase